jgi:hypothetical protein
VATELPRPAFYALAGGGWRDWLTILHPPYTAWHLSYVVIGAALAPELSGERLVLALLAFFLAVGIGAHALDELTGRPLGTRLSGRALAVTAAVSVAGAAGIGILVAVRFEPWLAAFIVAGIFLVSAYNLELFGGRFHSDWWFAGAWGAFPLLTAYFTMAGTIRLDAAAAAVFAFALSYAQRRLSTAARRLRRKTTLVEGRIELQDGTSEAIDRRMLLAPLEAALAALTVGVCALAVALVIMRLG